MPNYVTNELKIQCNNLKTMEKIKHAIFIRDDNGNAEFSMQKLLPVPPESIDQAGDPEYRYYWCLTMWGTKWDVCFPKVKESGDTLILVYQTAWDTNDSWVKMLCNFINMIVRDRENTTIQIDHDFWELGMGFGGKLIWKPGEKIKYHRSDIMEYAYLYDRPLHDDLANNCGFPPFIPEKSKNDI